MMTTLTDTVVTNGKAPEQPESSTDIGFRPQPIVKVQPARLEDLQPSYAQVMRHADGNEAGHGWYASMS